MIGLKQPGQIVPCWLELNSPRPTLPMTKQIDSAGNVILTTPARFVLVRAHGRPAKVILLSPEEEK